MYDAIWLLNYLQLLMLTSGKGGFGLQVIVCDTRSWEQTRWSFGNQHRAQLHRDTEEGHRLQDHWGNQICHAGQECVETLHQGVSRDSALADSNYDDDEC